MASVMELPAERGERPEAAAVCIFLLGGFRVERDGRPVPDTVWQRPQSRTLVKLLATERTHRLHREQIAEIFWPDRPVAMANANLRKLLFMIRQALPLTAGAVIGLRDDVVGLDSEHVWIDADAFAEEAHAALTDSTIETMEGALALYGGDLLPEERYESWAAERREELAALQRRLLLALAQALSARGERARSIIRLLQVLALDRADETVHRELMRLYAAAGQRREALRQYKLCRAALDEELGVEPDEQTEVLRKRIEQGDLSSPALPPAVTRRWATPLIGRERALDLVLSGPIRGGAEHAGADQPGLVLVRGEAGVGKTRLAAEAGQEASRRGSLVLWGTCHHHVAYGPVVEALEQHIGALSAAERAELAGRHPEIARILPSLELIPVSAAGHDGGDELRLFAAIARLLTDLAALQPVLLVLDDLHLADEATVALLSYLARLPSPRRNWLLLATYRVEDARAGSALGRSIAKLLQSERCRQVDLLQLARRECDRLIESILGAAIDESVSAYVFQTALGNPLFVVELVGALHATGDLERTKSGWRLAHAAAERPILPISGRIADLIASRISSLDEETRRLLSLVAVAGMSVPYAVLQRAAELAGSSVEGLLAGLEAAVEARVLMEEVDEPEGHASSYGFQHPLFREAVYEGLSAARRAHLHDVVAQAIEAVRPNDLEALAHHYVRSGDRAKSVLYLERAADYARSVYANSVAEVHYRRLLGLLAPSDDVAHIAQARLKLGSVLNVLGRYDEALAVLGEAARGLEAAGNLDGLGRVVATIGEAHVMRGTARDVVARLEETIEQLDGRVDPLVLAELYDALARCLFALGRYGELADVSELGFVCARERADDPGAKWYLGRAAFQRAVAAGATRPPPEKQQVLTEVMPVIERAGDPRLLMLALNLAANNAAELGDMVGSCRYYEQALEAAEQVGNPQWIGRLRCFLGRASFFIGRWTEGLQIAEEGHAQLAALGTSLYLAYGNFTLGSIYLGLGRREEARTLFEGVPAIAGNDLQAVRMAESWAAELDLIEGEPQRACRRLEPLVPAESSEAGIGLARAHLAWTYAALGDAERAMRLAEQAVTWGRTTGSPVRLVESLLAQGAALIELEEWDAAGDALTEALDLTRQIRYIWREPFILLLRARLHQRRSDPNRAREYLCRARDLLHQMGGDQAVRFAEVYAGTAQSPITLSPEL